MLLIASVAWGWGGGRMMLTFASFRQPYAIQLLTVRLTDQGMK